MSDVGVGSWGDVLATGCEPPEPRIFFPLPSVSRTNVLVSKTEASTGDSTSHMRPQVERHHSGLQAFGRRSRLQSRHTRPKPHMGLAEGVGGEASSVWAPTCKAVKQAVTASNKPKWLEPKWRKPKHTHTLLCSDGHEVHTNLVLERNVPSLGPLHGCHCRRTRRPNDCNRRAAALGLRRRCTAAPTATAQN